MNVVYASNDGYARHLAVSLYSLLEHNRQERRIVVYILSLGLSEASKKKLKAVVRRFRRQVEFLELGNLTERFSFEVDTGGFDISIMARLFIADVLPENAERVLYLDCDTVVLQSLTHLWNTDLKGKILGAVMEPTIYPEVKKQIGLEKEQPYFNSGVLLIDMKRWREEDAQWRLLDFYKKMDGRLFAGDQDTINGALKGRIKALSPRYNFFTNYRYFHYEDLTAMSPVYAVVTKRQFQCAKRHPFILHYMGDERPWKRGNLNHYRRAYERYLKQTPWAITPKESGQELYMLAYHAVDYVTFLCPPVRRLISRRLGMRMINARKKIQEQREA